MSDSSVRSIELIARRELRVRLRSKAFRISTVVLLLFAVGFALIMTFIRGGEEIYRIGVTRDAVVLTPAIEAVAAAGKTNVDVQVQDDTAEARESVRAGELDALVSSGDGRLHVVVETELQPSLQAVFESVAKQDAATREIAMLGGDPAQFAQAIGAAGTDVEAIVPPKEYNPEQLALGSIAGILIYIALMFAGQIVTQGVVEEKSSRVVEVLLATVRSSELMTGKVIGIGLVGLIQLFIIGAGGVLAGIITGALTLSLSTLSATLLWLLVWFLLGYGLYSMAFAATGALVSRQEEVGGVITPVMMPLVVGYILGISVLPSDPANRVCEVLSMIPIFSPVLMPMRLAIGGVPAWQAAVAVTLTCLAIPALAVLSGRIYRRAIVRTGGRVKLAEVLR